MIRHPMRALGLVIVAALLDAQPVRRTRNVVLVVTDGLRWQDVFTGADSTILFGDPRFVGDTAAIRRDFWRTTPEERNGQIYGNRARGSSAQATNGLKFS